MSLLDEIQNKADLQRFIEQTVAMPGVIPSSLLTSALPFKNFKFGTIDAHWVELSYFSENVEVKHGLGVPATFVGVFNDLAGVAGAEWEAQIWNADALLARAHFFREELPAGSEAGGFWMAAC
jgi:hypothetical protein